ncbi:MAG: deoxyhypusine synthase family protein [candidate division Zixibacteria bacterium]|nr:deoxyhypusine synthase family protein [candidate division Zixibacteria bacterium]
MGKTNNPIRDFIKIHYKHFNAAVIVEAAQAWVGHLDKGGKMLLTLAGAMSTGEIGISLAEMIRKDKVHGICATAANLEEDIFNLVAHSHYKRVPHYRTLSAQQELELLKKKMNRVTDTCIPEEEAMRRIERKLLKLWQKADKAHERYFPYEYIYQLLKSGALDDICEIDPKNSWVLSAYEKNIPIFTPGWEDSTLGNVFVANVIREELSSYNCLKSGLEQMELLVNWYRENTKDSAIGFFQIGGGIAGDFAICVVPLIQQDLKEDCRLWGYFAQISDSTTSYGSYSGAVPNEKITWGKLGIDTPRFIIESDASIAAPLIFGYVLGK